MKGAVAARLIYRPGMTAEEELAPVLSLLRREHDVLPFLGQQLGAAKAAFRLLPDETFGQLAASPDFRPPELGGPPIWLQLEAEGGASGVLIVFRPRADDELWAITPGPRAGGDSNLI